MPLLEPTKRTHKTAPTLSVDEQGRVLPSTELCRVLGLDHGSPIDLLPPASRNGLGPWHLDCRHTARSRLTHTRDTAPSFTSRQKLPERAFCRYHGRGQFGQRYRRITLELVVAGLEDFDYYTFKVVDYANPAAE